jgi:hypothetical protein
MESEKERLDETAIRQELTDAMLVAGVTAYHDWEDRRRTNGMLSVRDLVSEMWIAFRRASDPNL